MKVQKKILFFFIRAKLLLLSRFNKRKAGKEAFKMFCTPFPTVPLTRRTIFDDGEGITFTLNDQLIFGTRFNTEGTKKALVLHGFSSHSRNFHHYVRRLVKLGYVVYAFDAPAHGFSEGETTNAVEYSKMILMAAQTYGPFDVYLAHSFGGMAICLALEEMVHDEKIKVVLIAPATETTSAIDSALKMLGIKSKLVKDALCDEIKQVSGREASWFSIRRAMKNIRASVLWIHDEDDDVTPLSDALKVKDDGYSNIKFMITKHLGHRRIYRDQSVLNSIFEFLKP